MLSGELAKSKFSSGLPKSFENMIKLEIYCEALKK